MAPAWGRCGRVKAAGRPPKGGRHWWVAGGAGALFYSEVVARRPEEDKPAKPEEPLTPARVALLRAAAAELGVSWAEVLKAADALLAHGVHGRLFVAARDAQREAERAAVVCHRRHHLCNAASFVGSHKCTQRSQTHLM